MSDSDVRSGTGFGFGLFTLFVMAIFIGLGIWQLQRRVEKHALIAALDARLAAAPVPLPPPAQWKTLTPSVDEFRRVTFSATFEPRPDVMVFDLDPDEGMDLATVRRGVREIKGILAELSLNSYLKTSGGKGYHVVVPLQPGASWDTFHEFARRVAEVMEAKWPDRYTSNVRKAKRAGRIFIDWMRNGRGATSIAPYSIRAKQGAGVSMPIAWEELDTVAPNGIHMADALARIGGDDPWRGFFENRQLLR